MIDEKKIAEAAHQYMLGEYYDNGNWEFPCDSDDIKSQCELNFIKGAEWFKETLWHDTLIDKPKGNAPIAILYEELTFVIDVLRNYKWEVVKSYAVKWCYLSDLLPKGCDK